MQIQRKLSKFPVPDAVWEEYWLDQEINDRGICVDMEMVEQAIAMDKRSHKRLTEAMRELTELDNPNSVQQMKHWLAENGLETDTLGKKAVAELIRTAPQPLREVLELRQQLSKSSVKKYTAMENAVCTDSRARGMFQFYGANRTGRYSGRLIQLQNLPQNHMPDLEQARELVRSGNFEALDMLYGSVPEVLSELIRTAFVPRAGCKYIVADFSAIEARVIAWFAGERWRLDVFRDGGDIYCASASQMFKVPVEKHGVNGHLRQKGKIAELALGYGGSVGALKSMGALEMGVVEDELQGLVTAWRNSNPQITKFWWDVDRTVKECVKKRVPTETHGVRFSYQSGILFTTLPSGRRLAYVKPRIGENQFGGESVTYEGVGGTKKWERLESYGPKFVENIVQATARDILCYAMRTLRCCSIVAHVHDEIIIEADPRMSLMQFIIDHTDDEIKAAYQKMSGMSSPQFDGMPHSHNPQAGEERIIKGIEEIDVLKERYRQAMEYMEGSSQGGASTEGRTRIMGTAVATATQMQSYIKSVNPAVAQSVIDMIPLYLSEGAAEGVRGDIAFAQSCLETGNFGFSGSAVTLDQNNFCGMGVTANGMKGSSFDTPQLGIRAQIQHLKAYASKDALKNAVVDPRFQYVARGCAEYVEWLGQKENPVGKGWATGLGYGSKILTILQKMVGTAGSTGGGSDKLYRVRKSWADASSQKGAFSVLANAKSCADSNPGYTVYDSAGNAVYTSATKSTVPYLVKVSIADLNIRKGPGTNYDKTGKYTGIGTFTIMEERNGQGSAKGWGRLKSGVGWISLDYATKS